MVAEGPDLQAIEARLGDHLRLEEREERDDRRDDVGLALQQPPDAKHERQRHRRDPRQQQEQPKDAIGATDAHAVPRDRQPAPGVPGELAGPVLIALIENGH